MTPNGQSEAAWLTRKCRIPFFVFRYSLFLYLCTVMMKGHEWYNKLQFCAILLSLAGVAVDWHLGLWMSALLVVASVVKAVAEKRLGNPALSKGARWALAAMVVYVAVCAAAMLYSDNLPKASAVMGRKAVMLVYPLCFLLTDTSYMNRRHFAALFFGLAAALVGMFVYNAATGTFIARHHSYSALYILTALSALYFMLVGGGSGAPGLRGLRPHPAWLKVVLCGMMALMMVYTIYVNSRAGILCLYGLLAMATVHLCTRIAWWKAVLIGGLLVGATYLADNNLPGHQSRMEIPLEKGGQAADGGDGGDDGEKAGEAEPTADARYYINRTALIAIGESPVVGYGLGDYDTVLVDHYAAEGYDYGAESRFNAHNQYTEDMLAGGIPRLLALLAMLLAPLMLAVRMRSAVWPTLAMTFITMCSLLFESMLERQMGLLFIGLVATIMVLIINDKEKKFGYVQKD